MKLIGPRDLHGLIGAGRGFRAFRAWIDRQERAKDFPARVYLSDRVIAWDADAVHAWLSARRRGIENRAGE
jgi:hypothetical protein